jgi:hypothetical protein
MEPIIKIIEHRDFISEMDRNSITRNPEEESRESGNSSQETIGVNKKVLFN